MIQFLIGNEIYSYKTKFYSLGNEMTHYLSESLPMTQPITHRLTYSVGPTALAFELISWI